MSALPPKADMFSPGNSRPNASPAIERYFVRAVHALNLNL